MRLHRIACVSGLALVAFSVGLGRAAAAGSAKDFRISAVQDTEIWIEGGLLDGLEQGMDGEVCYEISVMGQKKRIVPAKVRLSKVEDRQSVGTLREQSGIINIGYSASFVEKPASDLLLLFNKRASEAYAAKDFRLAEQYYHRILEVLPGDAFASQKIRDCEVQAERLNELERERRNIPYYREVIRTSLDAKDPESLKIARSYVEKILLIEPEDMESRKIKEQLTKLASESVQAAPPPVPPLVEANTPVPNPAFIPQIEERKESQPKVTQVSNAPNASDLLKNMALVPEGDYSIGSLPGQSPFGNETPKHAVHIAAFYMDKYEVTNEEYKKFCDATGRSYPGYFSGKEYPPGAGKKPVVSVSWSDADAYARWAGKRLPSEIEWEAAASGLSGKVWPWGNRWIANGANIREKGENDPADVGSHPLDVSEFGIFDMAGNVSEWTQDWYLPYPGNKSREKEYGDQFKVLRGGSSKASKEFARSQFRARLPMGFRSTDLGFRCAISAEDVKK